VHPPDAGLKSCDRRGTLGGIHLRLIALVLLVAVATFVPLTVPALVPLPAGGSGTFNFELVGHDPLFARGMNAAPALYDHYVYVGSRTDGSPAHQHSGIVVVDVADPAHPTVVGEIGRPTEALLGMTSRELRVWPGQGILIVMNFACSSFIHACVGGADQQLVSGVNGEVANFKFFDIAADPVNPPLLATWQSVDSHFLKQTPHEMFLWVDPANPASRALMYVTSPGGPSQLIVADISSVRTTGVKVLGDWGGQRDAGLGEPTYLGTIPPGGTGLTGSVLWNQAAGNTPEGRAIFHSLSVTPDGRVGHVAFQGAGYIAIDTSDFANGVAAPRIRLLTPLANRIDYSPPLPPEVHSAVKVPGASVVMLTDEVYPFIPYLIPDGGCPWGWVHFVDITDVAHPALVGDYKTAQNDPSFCPTSLGAGPLVSYTSHNPTVLRDVALVTWHSAGLQAFAPVPGAATPLGAFYPVPLTTVGTEDPALGGGAVTMWSYPIVHNGLVYVVDLRNGLYVLRYTGPHADEVAGVSFLEGNSNLGDAARLEAGL
jgi:hypothetical protein